MTLQKIALVALAGVVFAGCTLGGAKDAMVESEEAMETQTDIESGMMEENTTSMEEPTMMDEKMTTYSLAQVAEHSTKTDCWVVVKDGVYDVSDFVMSGKHAGGDISSGCGTDISEMFFNRPNDKGEHPENAQDFLATMKIGIVQTEQ